MWSQGRGLSRQGSVIGWWGEIFLPISQSPNPPISITFHSPFSTWRYFQLRPASAIATPQALYARSMLSYQESIPAPNSQARCKTLPRERSPLPIKSSIADSRTSVKFTFTPFMRRNSCCSNFCLRSNSAVATECH